MMRGALIGLGNVALNGHLPAWNKETQFQIVAGVDMDRERCGAYQKVMTQSQVYSSLKECESLNLDFVDVCTPPHTHAALVVEALERGYHVICEKPLALSSAELERIESAGKKSSRLVCAVHNWKYAPLCRKISEIVERGDIGKVRTVVWYVLRQGPAVTTDAENWRLDPKRAGGGILMDHGWHAFYLLMQWMNSVPCQVRATLENRLEESLPVEDTVKVLLDFESAGEGTAASEIFLTWASRLRRNWGVIEGSQGVIRMEDGSLKLERAGQKDETILFEPLSAGSHHPDWFEGVIREFQGEIENQNQRGTNLQVAKNCLRLIEKSKESHMKQSAVAVH
ncbi:MAG: Gfo/Idh/MocA family oxidoreductase [Elusimicrobia bacterium]|nr:Gfo/Idh/MocA family oxidoreductase [Elusimicrobiota bacterium]